MARLIFLAGAFAATILVTLWAIAPPSHRSDPLAALAHEVAPAFGRVTAWYRSGPADGVPDWQSASHNVLGGTPREGVAIMEDHGCGTCHVIPGVARAHGTVGPPLGGFADRAYVAGVLSNRPGALIDWLMDPVAFSPDTAMPDLELTEAEARHVAAYLYTLRQ